MNKKRFIAVVIIILVLGGAGLLFLQMQKNKPIKIGFIAEYNANNRAWISAGRDGIIMKIEELNAAGGIKGRQIELIVKDVTQYGDNPQKAIDELIEEKVVGILGPMTSTLAEKIVPYTNQKKLYLVSPSASTAVLSKQDDYFFRATITLADNATLNADYCYDNYGWRKISGIYTERQMAYTKGWYDVFAQRFQELGGEMHLAGTVKDKTDMNQLALNIIENKPDGILLVSEAIESATICQELYKENAQIPVIANGIVLTPEFIQYGGDAVEGVTIAVTFFRDLENPVFKDFLERYLERFGREPNLPDAYGYDAATIFTDVLKKSFSWSADSLKQTTVKLGSFKSPVSSKGIVIDQYGDAHRGIIYIKVKDGKFISLD